MYASLLSILPVVSLGLPPFLRPKIPFWSLMNQTYQVKAFIPGKDHVPLSLLMSMRLFINGTYMQSHKISILLVCNSAKGQRSWWASRISHFQCTKWLVEEEIQCEKDENQWRIKRCERRDYRLLEGEDTWASARIFQWKYMEPWRNCLFLESSAWRWLGRAKVAKT